MKLGTKIALLFAACIILVAALIVAVWFSSVFGRGGFP